MGKVNVRYRELGIFRKTRWVNLDDVVEFFSAVADSADPSNEKHRWAVATCRELSKDLEDGWNSAMKK